MAPPTLPPISWNVFSLRGAVGRGDYLAFGIFLMMLKYGVEAGTILAATGDAYWPLDFLSPLLSSRTDFIKAGGDWLGWAWLLWSVPFVWIAVAMTLRRARSAGLSPWVAMSILVPIVNFATMLALSLVPSKEDLSTEPWLDTETSDDQPSPWQSPQVDVTPNMLAPASPEQSAVLSAFGGLAVGAIYTLVITGLSTFLFHSYGGALFFGTPIVAGATTGYLYNRPTRRSLGATVLLALMLVMCISCSLLLIGMEGAICILMALPILGPLVIAGAVIGRAIATSHDASYARDDRGMIGCLLVLPLLAGVEPMLVDPMPRSVVSSIDIAAPPELVWKTVVAFPEIDTQPEWFFRWGIASPLRARIDGRGVGAVRHCEFTTGDFVEPITVWDEPRRLAFDVTEQPDPMFELTPYRHLHPPHLKTSFRSTRGEFKLEALPNGGTRLIGTTWYELDIAPHAYWHLWTDEIVHRIHLRVLRHIKNVAEEE